MSRGRGDPGPRSHSLLWFLHSKLRFKRQRLSLHLLNLLITVITADCAKIHLSKIIGIGFEFKKFPKT